jgi:phosphatidylethanolamine/phosphatidyl-N-methylethanolamine N-methyltransferase
MEITTNDVRIAYQRHSYIYDAVFGPVLHTGREQAIRRMGCLPGERVLEVGVGTGLSLSLYPWGVRVVGVDLSTPMLGRARARAAEAGAGLAAMDAERMAFPDASFDKVVAMYVASVVPDPAALVREMRRVCRSDDGLYFVNHFRTTRPLLGTVERLFAPLSRTLGFRPDFSLEGFLAGAGLEVVERRPVGPLGYWSFLRARALPPSEDFDLELLRLPPRHAA